MSDRNQNKTSRPYARRFRRVSWLALTASLALPAFAAPSATTDRVQGVTLQIPLAGDRVATRIERTQVENETIRSAANETIEILFSDGGSIVLAPNSQVTILAYAFDPATGAGQLEIRIDQGAARIMGGQLNRATKIAIKTPHGEATLSDGGAFVDVGANETRLVLLVAGRLEIEQGGRSVALERAGFETRFAEAAAPLRPRRQSLDATRSDLARMNPGLLGGAFTTPATPSSSGASDPEAPPQTAENTSSPGDDGQSQNGGSGNGNNGGGGSGNGNGNGGGGTPTDGNSGNPTNPPVDPQPSMPVVPDPMRQEISFSLGGEAVMIDSGPPGAGTSASGNAEGPADAEPDRGIAQTLVDYNASTASGTGFRDPGATTNRILGAGSNEGFSYRLSNQTPGSIDTDLIYAYSLGLGATKDGVIDNPVQINVDDPTQIRDLVLTDGTVREASVAGFLLILPESQCTGSATSFDCGGAGLSLFPLTFDERGTWEDIAGSDALDAFSNYQVAVPVEVLDREKKPQVWLFNEDAQGTGFAIRVDGPIQLNANGGDTQDSDPLNFQGFANPSPEQSLFYVLQDGFGSSGNVHPTLGFLADPAEVQIFSQTRDPDNFLFIEASRYDEIQAGSVGPKFVFAAGDVSSSRVGEASIDTFNVTRGLSNDLTPTMIDLDGDPNNGDNGLVDGLAFPGTNPSHNFRAFAPLDAEGDMQPTLAPDALTSTPLLVINPAAAEMDVRPSRLFHVDLGLSPDGQFSTTALTLGTLTYQNDLDDNRSSITVDGTTLATYGGNGVFTSLYTSPLGASATGGGRWVNRDGYVSYLVLENVGTATQGDNTGGSLSGQLGNSIEDSDGYAQLRLAAGVQTRARDTSADLSGTYAAGYYGGLVETTTSIVGSLGSLDLTFGAETVTADIELDAFQTSTGGSGATVQLDDGTYVDPDHYGATNGNAALYSGISVADELRSLTVSRESVDPAQLDSLGLNDRQADDIVTQMESYTHLQWGFMLGDLSASDVETKRANLASWSAGQRLSQTEIDAITNAGGTANFQGHAIGNVANGMNTYTALGEFTQTWNLQNKTGEMNLLFDDRLYRTALTTVDNQPGYAYSGLSENAGRTSFIRGELVGVSGPDATVGAFEISSGMGENYAAVGTFGGERTDTD